MRQYLDNLNLRPAAKDDVIAAFERTSGHKLPAEYRDFLKVSNGAEGFVGDVEYVIIWGADELEQMNEAYEVKDYAPDCLSSAPMAVARRTDSIPEIRIVRLFKCPLLVWHGSWWSPWQNRSVLSWKDYTGRNDGERNPGQETSTAEHFAEKKYSRFTL